MVGGRDEQMAAINLCRCHDGIVVLRTGDVIVIEVTGGVELQKELCRRLGAGTVTHLCQSGAGAGLDFARHFRPRPENAMASISHEPEHS